MLSTQCPNTCSKYFYLQTPKLIRPPYFPPQEEPLWSRELWLAGEFAYMAPWQGSKGGNMLLPGGRYSRFESGAAPAAAPGGSQW